MKNLFPITFFILLILFIILLYLDIPNRQLYTTMSMIPVLSIWFFSSGTFTKSTKIWMTLFFTFMFIGFSSSQLILRGENYIAKNTLINIIEYLFLIPVIIHLGLNKNKNLGDEIFKFLLVAVLALIYIMLFFELFSFFEQTIIFFRILQLGLLFRWTWKNPKIHPLVHQSQFIMIISNVLFVITYADLKTITEELFVLPIFLISKYMLVLGLIKSFQKKKFRIY